MSARDALYIDWYPQPRQEALLAAAGLLDCVTSDKGRPKPPIAPIIGYGGAAYGGKTDGQLGIAITAAFAYKGCNIGFARRTFPELNMLGGAIQRSEEILTGIAGYNKTDHKWTFPNGSKLQFIYAQNESDVLKYKSSQFDILLIDEATTFTWYMVDYLLTRNRATVDGITPFCVMTTNPGDVGHAWYMQVFDTINAHGPHLKVKQLENPNGRTSTTYFIPAFVTDNVIGLSRDPHYADRLAERDPETARALLAGDWTVFAGQAFPQWRYDKYVKPWQELPREWPAWRSLDYGWDHPTVVYWWKKNPENGRLYVLREWEGRQMDDRQIAEAVKTATLPDERVLFTFASPDMWKVQRANEIVTTAPQTFAQHGIILTKADDQRINGKRKFNNVMSNLADGEPGLVVFDNCTGLIRTMPTLVRDKTNPEDVQKVDGDDYYDSARYGLTNQQTQGTQPQPRTSASETRQAVRRVFS